MVSVWGGVPEISDSWETIVQKINNGTADYEVGECKSLDLGTEGVVRMQIVGKNTSELADGTGTATYDWISIEALYNKHAMNSSNVIANWETSEMRSYLKNTIKPLLPQVVKNNIKEVRKYTKGYTNTLDTDIETIDELWIPSIMEVSASTGHETKGPKYSAVYNTNTSRVKKYRTRYTTTSWFLRSAYNSTTFFAIKADGSFNTNAGQSSSDGVVLGFSL